MGTASDPEPTVESTDAQTIGWQAMLRMVVVLVLISAILFVSAGTLAWPMAWAYLAIYMLLTIGGRYVMFRKDPSLIKERAEYDKHEDVESWDRRLMPIVAMYGPLVVQIVAGLNRRFGWGPEIPLWLQLVALVVLTAAICLATWATLVNRYFSGVVRIQKERGHTVVSSGPYGIVRHPGYAFGIVAHVAIPVVLGSVWALVPAVVVIALTVLRTALEDRTLQAKLAGYREYAERVRYRLLPGVW